MALDGSEKGDHQHFSVTRVIIWVMGGVATLGLLYALLMPTF